MVGVISSLANELINQTVRDPKLIDFVAATSGNGSTVPIELANVTVSDSDDAWSARDPEMGQQERTVWVLLFSLMVVVATGGNVIVIYIVSTNKEMKSVTNYFLVNLSLADTMVSTLNVIFNFISMLNSNWPFGALYCKISNFIAILSISASVFTLTAISSDRYKAIIHPLRPRMSHKHALAWIVLIWTASAVLALPNLIFSVLFEVEGNPGLTCTMIWPDGRYPVSSYDHIYNIIILVVTYFVPILTMAILYYRVGRELWGHQTIGENVDSTQIRALMAKKKVVRMMIVVVTIFALCWLPYHAFFVVNYYVPTIFQEVSLLYQRIYLIMYWLAMSNSMYNPIIIYFMNSKFRKEFQRALCLICCCRFINKPCKISAFRSMVTNSTYVQATNGANDANNATKQFNNSQRRRHTTEASPRTFLRVTRTPDSSPDQAIISQTTTLMDDIALQPKQAHQNKTPETGHQLELLEQARINENGAVKTIDADAESKSFLGAVSLHPGDSRNVNRMLNGDIERHFKDTTFSASETKEQQCKSTSENLDKKTRKVWI